MNRNANTKKLLGQAVVLGLAMGCGSADAVDVYLCAGATTVTMPDGTNVPMWGYALDNDTDGTNGCGNPIQVPGPVLDVPVGDPLLTVHLQNDLAVATSVVIPGQAATMEPTFVTDSQGRTRVQSMTHETAPGTNGTYSWTNVQPGSYVYHSGTHIAVQVQMGLYGPVRKDEAAGVAYVGVPYDQEVSLFYSEIDPALHGAVSDGSYGATGPTSTINYQPKYFLVNGAPYDGMSTPLTAAAPGQRTLLRMYNMGLRTIIPTLLGQHVTVVAEDGNKYPYARQQYAVMLAAAKTRDAIFTPVAEGTYALFDRSLNLSNAAAGPGGQYSFLQVSGAAGAVTATGDTYTVAEDTPLNIAAPGVLANDIGSGLSAILLDTVTQGSLALAADGAFNYTPSQNFTGTAQFTYQASDGTSTSAPALVSITVTPVNDAPVTVADAYTTTMDTPLTVADPGVLANDHDVDSTLLAVQVAQVIPPVSGTLSINSGGGFVYTPGTGFTGTDTFSYTAQDDLGAVSNVSVVTITVNPAPGNQPPVAVDDYQQMKRNLKNTVITVLANDSDPDGSLDPASVTIVTPPAKSRNTAAVNPDGTITFTPGPGFRGSDVFEYTVRDNAGAVSNIATVRVDVVR